MRVYERSGESIEAYEVYTVRTWFSKFVWDDIGIVYDCSLVRMESSADPQNLEIVTGIDDLWNKNKVVSLF